MLMPSWSPMAMLEHIKHGFKQTYYIITGDKAQEEQINAQSTHIQSTENKMSLFFHSSVTLTMDDSHFMGFP